MPGVNHLLVPATTGEVDEYSKLGEASVSPQDHERGCELAAEGDEHGALTVGGGRWAMGDGRWAVAQNTGPSKFSH